MASRYGRWIRDVLVWTKVPLLFRNELDASVFSSLVPLVELGFRRSPRGGTSAGASRANVSLSVGLRTGRVGVPLAAHPSGMRLAGTLAGRVGCCVGERGNWVSAGRTDRDWGVCDE